MTWNSCILGISGYQYMFIQNYSNLNMDHNPVNMASLENNSDSVCVSSHELQHKLKPDTSTANPPLQLISPEFAYHLLLSAAFGMVALTTQRFKVLWVPHMCVLAAGALANLDGWRIILKRIGAIKSNNTVSRHTFMGIDSHINEDSIFNTVQCQIFQFIGISTLIAALVIKVFQFTLWRTLI